MGEDRRTNVGAFRKQCHSLLFKNFSYSVTSVAFETFGKSVSKISEVGLFAAQLNCTLRGGHIVVRIIDIFIEGLVKYYSLLYITI